MTKTTWWKKLSRSFRGSNTHLPELDEAAQELVDNAVAFDQVRIEDIMVPLADVKAVDIDCSLTDLAQAFIDAGHSRLPVYRGNLDDPIGMVHIKDLLPVLLRGKAANTEDASINLQSIARDVLFVPPSMDAGDLLVRMQKTRVHMALVVDEYGGTDGLVTLEDLIEQIVGDIEDEHDTDTITLRKTGPDCWEASARLPITQLEASTGAKFRSPNDEDEVDTLGGLVFTLSGRVPAAGEILRHKAGFEFEIKRADPRRIITLIVRRVEAKPPQPGS
ncbi:MAG: HlyC/CorC family transporter [Robiginitomaculum sp.]|nr:HlyC/CorC family transporter [Robiginitomaculum sp.]